MDVHEALGIDFHWDVRKLWAADLPITVFDIAELSWLLELPFRTVDERSDVRPAEVAANPSVFADEFERTMRTDLNCPINVM